ncbi:MAG: hypothetical protein QHH07_10750 [Sedimentisphaerales bacterium]|jgi:hypothetical protein|nr:hypothetical protein [Sedimentisphaerales bacterium]
MGLRKQIITRLAARLACGIGRPKVSVQDLSRMEFKASTQRIGVRFTERIRQIFRYRWIRRTRPDRY